MQPLRKVEIPVKANWSTPVIKQLAPDDALVRKALSDPDFAAAAQRARTALAS